MNIASFNIENLDFDEDEKNPVLAARIPLLKATFERMDADIICLQEVHGQELEGHTSDHPKRDLLALQQVLAGTRYESFNISVTHTTQGVPYDKRNLVVLSSPEIAVKNIAQYKNQFIDQLMYKKITEKPQAGDIADAVTWERPILHVQLALPTGDLLHVINLHLKSRLPSNIKGQKDGYEWKSAAGWAEGYFLSSMKRVGQALETRVLLDHIFEEESEAKIIVCGDFNAEPGQVPVEAIQGRMENTNNAGLLPNALMECSRSIPDSIRYSHFHHGHGNLLDHMLISQSLISHFRSSQIFNETLHDESLPFSFDTKYPESDHAAFVSEFAF